VLVIDASVAIAACHTPVGFARSKAVGHAPGQRGPNRIRMAIGKKVWYERQPGDEIWHRVDDGSEFDIINPVAA